METHNHILFRFSPNISPFVYFTEKETTRKEALPQLKAKVIFIDDQNDQSKGVELTNEQLKLVSVDLSFHKVNEKTTTIRFYRPSPTELNITLVVDNVIVQKSFPIPVPKKSETDEMVLNYALKEGTARACIEFQKAKEEAKAKKKLEDLKESMP